MRWLNAGYREGREGRGEPVTPNEQERKES